MRSEGTETRDGPAANILLVERLFFPVFSFLFSPHSGTSFEGTNVRTFEQKITSTRGGMSRYQGTFFIDYQVINWLPAVRIAGRAQLSFRENRSSFNDN